MFNYCRIGIHLEGREFKFDDADPGFLQTSGFSTGFANGHYKYPSAVSWTRASDLWDWLQSELVCNDPRIQC